VTSVRKLEIRIDQTGDAGPGIKGIAGSVGKIAKVGLAAGTAAAVGVAALTTATVGLGAKLITLGADAGEMESKFNVVFGTSAPEATKALDEFGNAVGRNKFELMEMASTVQDTFVPLGFARDEAAGMSTDLTKLAVDMGSFNNVADAQVMLDLQSAIVGNHETMRKYGVVITQATLEQELMRAGLADSVSEATEQEKVQARLNLIMAGTSDAHGDAAETAGSWANQMRALKAEIAEGATAMGAKLMPVLLPLLQNFTEWVREIMPKAVEIFGQFAGNLGETVGPALALIKDAISRIAEAFGINTEEVSSTDAVLSAFKTTLDVIVVAIKAASIVIWGISHAIKAVSDAIRWVIDRFNDLKHTISTIDLPDWLTPGSATPLELGIRGISDAMKDVDMGGMVAGGMVAGGAMAGGGITINLTYSPTISLADRYEAEERLAPFIANALRKQMGVA
jgi:hypothetical protein